MFVSKNQSLSLSGSVINQAEEIFSYMYTITYNEKTHMPLPNMPEISAKISLKSHTAILTKKKL